MPDRLADWTVVLAPSVPIMAILIAPRATVCNIRKNLFGAFLYNSLGIPLAAGALYPAAGLLLNPMLTDATVTLSSFSVVTDANRLRGFQP